MPNPKSQDHGVIRVADVTLAQLSRGLYRSTATAFKELVSNAFDADAPVVRIDTNCPEFDYISCVDNGSGMSLDQFRRYFSEEGVGSCNKRKGNRDRTEIYGRPIIGRLGIGMMAIGQLCHSFEIESHYLQDGQGKAYHARIVLEDDTIPDREKEIRNDEYEKRAIEVGSWEYEEIDYDQSRRGFRLYSTDVRPTFTREMRLSLGPRDRNKLRFSLDDLHSTFYRKARKSIRECKAYLECIWELSILCPVPYFGDLCKFPLDTSAFEPEDKKSNEFGQAVDFIRSRQEQLVKYNFQVVFDGVELRRHVQLPTEDETGPKLYFIEFDGEVFERPLKFAGYFFAQVPRAVRPAELNGLQIRLREVGIGGYDNTFLKYSEEIETIRNRWVSGELFVDEGLESGLNIDRDSFNEHDEHFKRLQSEVHTRLRYIFNDIDRIARAGSELRREERDLRASKALRQAISRKLSGRLSLHQRDLGGNEPIVVVDESKGEIILNTGAHPLKRKRGDRLLGAVMLAYHAAERTATTDEERLEVFYGLLKDVLGEMM